MGVAENINLVREFYALGAADDETPSRAATFAPDAVWHVPGNNPVSGQYHGVHAITYDIGARMQPLDDWRIEVVDVMGNADIVVSVAFIVGQRRGRKVNMPGGHVFRFDEQGRIVEAWGYAADQPALDAFFSA